MAGPQTVPHKLSPERRKAQGSQTKKPTSDLVIGRLTCPHLIDVPLLREENPRRSQTLSDVKPLLANPHEGSPITTQAPHLRIRYLEVNLLGSGSFGNVYRVLDIDSPRWMAVKKLTRDNPQTDDNIKDEIASLSKVRHDNVISLIHSQGWDGPIIEIFTDAKEGTLKTLVENSNDYFEVANLVFPQLLLALQHLADKGIVHRDVKPDNILYEMLPSGKYRFLLADFGLSSDVQKRKFGGSKIFMAPEALSFKQYHVSDVFKRDVWSLYATIFWVLDIDGFQENSRYLENHRDIWHVLISASSTAIAILPIKKMVERNPTIRASASEMISTIYGTTLSPDTWHETIRVFDSSPHPTPLAIPANGYIPPVARVSSYTPLGTSENGQMPLGFPNLEKTTSEISARKKEAKQIEEA